MAAFIIDDILNGAARRVPMAGPAPVFSAQPGPLRMQWRRGPDGRPACRWSRASVGPPS